MIAPAALRTLRAIDWDFAAPRAGYVGPPHWYPGTFVPALSDALIEALTPIGGTVFDPYAGVGTTGWSALRTNRGCVLADLNPIAVLVSYASTSLLALHRLQPDAAQRAIGELARLIGRNEDLLTNDRRDWDGELLDARVAQVCQPAPDELLRLLILDSPNWTSLSGWYAHDTLTEIDRLINEINGAKSAYVRLLGICMISAIARNLNSQHSSWGHIADNVKPKVLGSQNVYAATGRWLKRAVSFARFPSSGSGPHRSGHHVEVFQRDWSTGMAGSTGQADLLLTSPPYADAIDYILSQRLSLYLFGYSDDEIATLVSTEIGARRKRFKPFSRERWSDQLCSALKEQITWLKPSGLICLVLPHRDAGRSGGEENIKAILADLGWTAVFERDRSIHQSHTRQSWTSIKQETIVAFAREQ